MIPTRELIKASIMNNPNITASDVRSVFLMVRTEKMLKGLKLDERKDKKVPNKL